MIAQKRQLYLAAFLMEIAYGLFLLIASLMAVKVIGSPFILGLTGTLHVVTRVLGNVVFGRLSDRIGRRILLLFACFLSLVSFVLLGFQSVLFIWLAYFISGVGNSIFWPLIESWIGHGADNKNLLRSLGLFGLAFTGGVTIGNLAGGFFMKIAPLVSIIFGCILLIAVSFLLFRTQDHPSSDAAVGSPKVESTLNSENNKLSRDVKDQFLWIGWIANFATWTTIGIIRFLFTKLCVNLDIPKEIIGSINAVLYSCWFVMFIAMMHFRGWIYKLRPLIMFQWIGIGALLMMWLWASKMTFFIAFGLFGVSAGMTYLSSMFYGQDGAHDKGNKSGLHEMVLGIGMIVGPFFGGVVAQLFSLQTPFLFCAIVVMMAMITEVVLYKRAIRFADAP